MPWSGSAPSQSFTRTDGISSGDDTWQQAAAAPRNIEADDHDTHDTDLKDGINACLKKDGGNTATANIPMGGFTLTNIGVATSRTMPARFSQLQDNAGEYIATVGGTADAITLTPSPAITAYAAGQRFSFIAGGTNTGAATVNVSGVGAKDIKRNDGSATALSAGDITTTSLVVIEYDGTNFLLLSIAKLPASLAATAGITSTVTDNTAVLYGQRYSANSNAPLLNLAKSRNATVGSHTIVQDGDVLGAVRYLGSDGTNFEVAASVSGIVDGTPGADDMPGALLFNTTADGAVATTERMAIRSDGKIEIPNRSAPLLTLNPTGFLLLAEISSPASPAANKVALYCLDNETLAYKQSDGNVVELRPATQAEMEAATSVVVNSSPGRQHFHPGHPKAGGCLDGTGTPAFASGDYGMGAVTDNGTGDYTFAFDTDFNDTNYWLAGWVRGTAGGQRDVVFSASSAATKTSSAFQLQIIEATGSSAQDSAEIGITFWGDYA